jgi:hypothetical protein
MTPDTRFLRQTKRFWANVRLLSEHVGYTQKAKAGQGSGAIKVPALSEVMNAFSDRGLSKDHLCTSATKLTEMGETLFAYFQHRADTLNNVAKKNLMNTAEAKAEFDALRRKLNPKCTIPMNKQKGDKKAPAYLTGIVNMTVEANGDGLPCNYNPLARTDQVHQR